MTTIVAGGDVVTMNPARDVLAGGSLVIDGDTIIAVGATTELRSQYPDADLFDASGCVVTPGMIDAHQHLTGDGLMRCCIPDLLDSQAAIFEWSVPLHSNHDGDDDEISATLSAVEALTNGITTVVEAGTVAHPERVVDGMLRTGIRGTIGTWGWDVDGVPFGGRVDEVLDRQRAVIERFPRGGMVEGWVTLVGHDLATDALFAGAAELARTAGTSMTSVASSAIATAGNSAIGSAWARLPHKVPRLRLAATPTRGIVFASSEQEDATRSDAATAACLVAAPIATSDPVSRI